MVTVLSVRANVRVIAACVIASCGYDATFEPCTIRCSIDTGCPEGMSCGEEALCRHDGETCAVAACNTAIDMGPVTALATFGGSTRVAATASPGRLVVAYGTAAGLTAVMVDLATPTTHGPETVIPSSIASNIHGVALPGRLVFTGTPSAGSGTAIAIVDQQLSPLGDPRVAQQVVVNAPDNSSTSDSGGVLVAGATDDTAQIAALDHDGANQISATYVLANAAGGSVATLVGDQYVGGWSAFSGACIVRVFDGALATTATLDLDETCSSLRVAWNGSRVGLAWDGSAAIRATTADPALSTTPVITLIPTSTASLRIAATADGFWVIAADSLGIRSSLLTPTGEVGNTVLLSPYDGSLYPYDVVTADGTAYAVWASPAASPDLYLERLCP